MVRGRGWSGDDLTWRIYSLIEHGVCADVKRWNRSGRNGWCHSSARGQSPAAHPKFFSEQTTSTPPRVGQVVAGPLLLIRTWWSMEGTLPDTKDVVRCRLSAGNRYVESVNEWNFWWIYTKFNRWNFYIFFCFLKKRFRQVKVSNFIHSVQRKFDIFFRPWFVRSKVKWKLIALRVNFAVDWPTDTPAAAAVAVCVRAVSSSAVDEFLLKFQIWRRKFSNGQRHFEKKWRRRNEWKRWNISIGSLLIWTHADDRSN